MVQMSAAIVANRSANRFRDGVEVGNDLLDRLLKVLGVVFEGSVEVVSVSIVGSSAA